MIAHPTPCSIGIVGAGAIVTQHHLPVLLARPDVRIAYLADTRNVGNIARLSGSSVFLLPQQLDSLPRVDAVLLATPWGARGPYYDAFATAGIPVMAEKPFAIQQAEHVALIRANPRLACNYNRRWFSSILSIKAMVAAQPFGRLRSVSVCESAMMRGTGKGEQHYQFKRELSGGGILAERGVHTLSQLDSIFEHFDLEVTAGDGILQDGLDVQVKASLLATTGDVRVPIEYFLTLLRPAPSLSVYRFEHASITFDHGVPGAQPVMHAVANQRAESWLVTSRAACGATEINQSFHLQWDSFLATVRGESALQSEIDTSLRTTTMVEKIYQLIR
jgi:predicted dehydrogenase